MDDGTRRRLSQHASTAKQREFDWDFTADVDRYEVWDEVEIGASGPAERTFLIEEEDVLAFNRAALETDPLLVDPDHARAHGGLVVHPLFLVQIAFWCIGKGIGSWIRSPGARNPGQEIEQFEPLHVGEEIHLTLTHWDKWIRRGHHYLQDRVDFRDRDQVLKARWFATLILPPTRSDLERSARAERP